MQIIVISSMNGFYAQATAASTTRLVRHISILLLPRLDTRAHIQVSYYAAA